MKQTGWDRAYFKKRINILYQKTKKELNMKKQTVSTLIVLIMILLAACKPSEADPLMYQSYPFSAKGSLATNGIEYVFEVKMTDKNNASLTFSSPDSLRGYLFNVSPNKTTLSYDDMTIDFSNNGEKTNIVNLIPSLFSLNKEDINGSEDINQNSVDLTVLTVKNDKGDIKVYINKQTGYPMRFEQGETVVSITEFTPITPQTPQPTETPLPTQTPPHK